MKYTVVSVHPTDICNLNCEICYKTQGITEPDESIWLGMPKYLKQITDQVAMGGGEITLFPTFIKKFGKECKKHDLIFNITTNGKLLRDIDPDTFKNVTMLSISYDKWKVINRRTANDYIHSVEYCKDNDIRVGCNLLVDKTMFDSGSLITVVQKLFEIGNERVFALYPKNFEGPEILKHRGFYAALSGMYKNFYVDDLTAKILRENSYGDWKTPCHYGKIISINEFGGVTGCSFCDDSKLTIKTPKDILGVKDIVWPKRTKCPYLV